MTWKSEEIIAQFSFQDDQRKYSFIFLKQFDNMVDILLESPNQYFVGLHRIVKSKVVVKRGTLNPLTFKAEEFLNRIIKIMVFA